MSSPHDTTHLIESHRRSEEPLEVTLASWENYKIQSVLGEGGMARVYKAFDPKLNRFVALKFIRSDNENYKKRLLREAKAQAQIEHDHVCKIFEVGEVENKPYIAMQLINGRTLQEAMKEMSIEQKILVMHQISDAVHSAHRIGIVHRDIKPSNIMLEPKEDGSVRPFIMDFGIAREISDPGLTATDVIVGTPSYMAPEQVSGDPHAIDRRTDVYGLGATLYYIFCGRPPFEGSGVEIFAKLTSEEPIPLVKTSPSIPNDVDVIVSKCLEKDPIRRYDSAKALADDLKRYLDGEPILAQRPSLKYRLIKKIKKNKTASLIFVVAFVIIIASAIFSLFSYWRASKEVQIARQFSQYVESMDWIMRVAYMSPLHDIRTEKAQVNNRMREIENLMKTAGDASFGPGNFALGRGYLALQNYQMARIHLEKAWNAGYREKEVSSALGITLGALFKSKLEEIDRISDEETRRVQLGTIEKEYRDPAVSHLRAGSASGNQSREYGEALLSFYEKNWSEALRLARNANQKIPWLYESKMLEGDVYLRLGKEAFQQGQFDETKKYFNAGLSSYSNAENTARSDPAVYESQCSLWSSLMEVQFGIGQDGKKEYDQSNGYCRKALIANAESSTAYLGMAQTSYRWGENQLVTGEDPANEWRLSIELSEKALRLNAEQASAFYLMGTSYGYLADYEIAQGKNPTESLKRSIDSLSVAVEKDPSSAPAFTNLGVSYFSQGSVAMEQGNESKKFFEKAIESYEKALKISPRYFAARANIANALKSIGEDAVNRGDDPMHFFEQSIENYKKALEINPNHWMIHNNLSTAYAEQLRYEIGHGKNIKQTFQKALAEAQISEKLKEGNWYAVLNASEDYIYRAEYALLVNEDPTTWLRKAEEKILPLLDEINFVHPFLAIAEVKKIEAKYAIGKSQSPLEILQIGQRNLERGFQINSNEHLFPLTQARFELIKAEWFISNHESPEKTLMNCENQLHKAMELNSRSAFVFEAFGKMHYVRASWKIAENKDGTVEIEDGLSAIKKSLDLKRDNAEAYITEAKLQTLQAQSKSAVGCQNDLKEAMNYFEQAFEINPLLRNQYEDDFQKAKSICSNR
jgi:serine/threonine-protein kinase